MLIQDTSSNLFPPSVEFVLFMRHDFNLLTLADTCNVTVTSTKAVSITWIQIKAALEQLVNVCVESPSASPVGGRAYLIASQTIAAVAAKLGNIALGGRGLSKRGNGGMCPSICYSKGEYTLYYRS